MSGRCEKRSEVFVKFQTKSLWGGGPGGGGGGGQGRCEWRSEVFVKFQKKLFFLEGGVGVDMNGEVKFKL